MASSSKKTLIIGAGLTGLSAAYHLKDNYALVEKGFVPGGMASSENIKDFIFDKAGHVLHFQTGYAKRLIENMITRGRLVRRNRFSWIFSKDTYTRYPFQINTYNLPPSVIKDCLVKMVRVKSSSRAKNTPDNLKDWILENFGEGIAEHFMFPYNRKLWQLPLSSIGIDWVDKFIPKTQLGYAIRGAVSDFKKRFGYNKVFYYPQSGGIQTISDAFLSKVRDKVFFGRKITGIDLNNNTAVFADGQKAVFRRIISTMPLTELIRITKGTPSSVRSRADDLKYVSVFNLNLGIDRKDISDKHWIYFPEREYIFYRVGFFSNFLKKCPIKNGSSLYAEVSYTADKPLRYSIAELKKRIINDLHRSGILRRNDRIIAEKLYDIKYAYPVCCKNGLVKDIDRFFKSHNVHSIGRYGSWRYMSMEECIIAGKLTADYINGL
jgi:protoporphyrinogen oxidase